ncbi:peptidoglycan recognition protein [Streptomyces sp. CRN 30]|uniref:peptidoglycan recognition protein family protein n=1 Tax=Streptomyces sp. CRN 30 TaxID=3075613 RepID=UPI002A80E159|nr:peptidoglycan recognition protein [Streptomyces sp. CRN 30]
MKRRAWLTLGAVVLGGGGIVTYAAASPSTDQGPDLRAKRPVKTYDLALKAAGSAKRELPRTETKQFSLLGVSWKDADASLDGTIQVRTRDAESGTWSGWRDLETGVDPVEVPEADSEERGATEPLWTGPSDGVEVQVVHEDGTTGSGLPKGFEVNLVDPGVVTKAEQSMEPAAFAADVTPSPTATETETTEGTAPSAAPESSVPQPPVVSRAGWGADESMSPEEPEYNEDVKAVFVHHTAGTNDYSCADSAALVRGIYAYHVKTNGWKDLGYNFLVDKCGTLYEGRKGGIDLPVLGAHTYGWNREATSVAVLGDGSTGAPAATLASIARVAAWKLGQYGADPNSSVKLTAGATQKNYFGTSYTAGTQYSFKRISGHRDGFNSECPGNGIYAQLPTIRTLASGPAQGLKLTALDSTGLSGSTYYTKGTVKARWSTSTPSSLLKNFEIVVDGKTAATAAATSTAKTVTLPLGTHTVAVRAVHQSGKTATTTAVNVVAETTAPTFSTSPSLKLRTGTVETSAVPVALGWKAADNAALRQVKLLSPTTATYGPTTTTSNKTAKSGSASTWSMRAYDWAGNYRTSSPSFTPMILQESAATKSGTWTTKSSKSYLGGKSYSSSTKNASLTWSFTGRSAALVVSRASSSGKVYVYVDGTKTATVDLKSSATKYRQAIWTKNWSSSAKHKIKIVVAGTSGRPAITTDGLVYLK